MPIISICTYAISLNLDGIASFWEGLRERAFVGLIGNRMHERRRMGGYRSRDKDPSVGLGENRISYTDGRLGFWKVVAGTIWRGSESQKGHKQRPLPTRLGDVHVQLDVEVESNGAPDEEATVTERNGKAWRSSQRRESRPSVTNMV